MNRKVVYRRFDGKKLLKTLKKDTVIIWTANIFGFNVYQSNQTLQAR